MSALSPSERGRLGGLATREKYGREHLRQIAKEGARETHQRHADKLSQWGKRGLQSMIDRYFAGDRDACFAWLAAYGSWATDPAPWNNAFPCPGGFPGPDGHSPGYVSPEEWEAEWERAYQEQAALDRLRATGKLPAPPFEIQTPQEEEHHECPV